MSADQNGREMPAALALLSSKRPRNVGWLQAGAMLFGDWGTSRLYVLGLAFLFAGRTSFWLILAMSVLTLSVAWAYTQICRLYPDGGGVYSAGKTRSRILAVIGALLLFADYTVTASLSSLEAFHYFGLPLAKHSQVVKEAAAPSEQLLQDAGSDIIVRRPAESQHEIEPLWAWDSPGLWAIIAIIAIGLFNLLGPKHSSAFALLVAAGMMAITALIAVGSLPQVPWTQLPGRMGTLRQPPVELWVGFVSIVLALSGVEAIANLTGVMKKPVAHTARRSIWLVAGEVALFNVLLAVAMVAIHPLNREQHANDMMAYLAQFYVGGWAEWMVRIVGGLLLLSATNTAVNGMMSIVYVMSRDGELPAVLQALNRFGAPWLGAVLAAGAPVMVLLVAHDLATLASLYAIGVIGAIALNVTLCALHPRLRRLRRKGPMVLLGLFLVAIWITLAVTKVHALLFVTVVLIVGLTARQITRRLAARKGPRPSLLQKAIAEQLPPDFLQRPKLLLGTYGSEQLASAAFKMAAEGNAVLVVCFIREIALSIKHEADVQWTIETDVAAQKTFSAFLEMGHHYGVPVLPVYDTGPDAAVLLAENAAIYGCQSVLIGSSRKGALYHLIKGSFQRRLEHLLPPEIPVQVLEVTEPAAPAVAGA